MFRPVSVPTYLLVTPVAPGRVEALFAAVARQEIAPLRWVVVDGTGDPEVARQVQAHARDLPHVVTVTLAPARGGRLRSRASAEGLRVALDILEAERLGAAFVAHLDPAVALAEDTLAELMVRLEQDRTLGLVGSPLRPEARPCPTVQTLDAATPGPWVRMWRRACLESVDFAPGPAWAEFTAAQARAQGWGMCLVPQAAVRVEGAPRGGLSCLAACADLGGVAWQLRLPIGRVPLQFGGWRAGLARLALAAGYLKAAARAPTRRRSRARLGTAALP